MFLIKRELKGWKAGILLKDEREIKKLWINF